MLICTKKAHLIKGELLNVIMNSLPLSSGLAYFNIVPFCVLETLYLIYNEGTSNECPRSKRPYIFAQGRTFLDFMLSILMLLFIIYFQDFKLANFLTP